MRHPVKKVHITQDWGVNYEVYVRFGLKGHNGIDYRLFNSNGDRATTAEVFAPHSGQVIETGYDANGYGNYMKIENGDEGSILAHLKSFNKAVGDGVNEGDLVAIANNTGFSTGAHLHWGYYPKPRVRDNGYSGTINQLLILEKPEEPECEFTDQTMIPIGGEWGEMELQAVRSTLNDQKRGLDSCYASLKECQEKPPKEVTVEVIKEVFIKPEFKHRLSDFLYQLAVQVEGKSN